MTKKKTAKNRGMHAKAKGARGERELAKFFRSKGYTANRGRQYCGSPESPDVVVHQLSHVHIECKRRERFTPSYYEQAKEDAFDSQIPVVCWKKNNGEWMAYLSLDDFIILCQTEAIMPDCPKGIGNDIEDVD